MDVGQVEAFLAVETFGGFRKAADAPVYATDVAHQRQ